MYHLENLAQFIIHKSHTGHLQINKIYDTAQYYKYKVVYLGSECGFFGNLSPTISALDSTVLSPLPPCNSTNSLKDNST